MEVLIQLPNSNVFPKGVAALFEDHTKWDRSPTSPCKLGELDGRKQWGVDNLDVGNLFFPKKRTQRFLRFGNFDCCNYDSHHGHRRAGSRAARSTRALTLKPSEGSTWSPLLKKINHWIFNHLPWILWLTNIFHIMVNDSHNILTSKILKNWWIFNDPPWKYLPSLQIQMYLHAWSFRPTLGAPHCANASIWVPSSKLSQLFETRKTS